jgi:peptidoglycan-associated lipoprotein
MYDRLEIFPADTKIFKEANTLKRKRTDVWLGVFLCLLLGLFVISCSKKEVKKEEPVTKPPVTVGEKGDKTVPVDRSKEEQERALKEAEARRLKEAAEKARFETEDIFFDFDQYLLSDAAKKTLNNKAQWMQQFPTAKILIEGHCDERGSAEYNLALGQRRADAALQYLTALGIRADRISTISFGKEKPVDPRSTEEAWAKNRRAHFVLK